MEVALEEDETHYRKLQRIVFQVFSGTKQNPKTNSSSQKLAFSRLRHFNDVLLQHCELQKSALA